MPDIHNATYLGEIPDRCSSQGRCILYQYNFSFIFRKLNFVAIQCSATQFIKISWHCAYKSFDCSRY